MLGCGIIKPNVTPDARLIGHLDEAHRAHWFRAGLSRILHAYPRTLMAHQEEVERKADEPHRSGLRTISTRARKFGWGADASSGFTEFMICGHIRPHTPRQPAQCVLFSVHVWVAACFWNSGKHTCLEQSLNWTTKRHRPCTHYYSSISVWHHIHNTHTVYRSFMNLSWIYSQDATACRPYYKWRTQYT